MTTAHAFPALREEFLSKKVAGGGLWSNSFASGTDKRVRQGVWGTTCAALCLAVPELKCLIFKRASRLALAGCLDCQLLSGFPIAAEPNRRL